MGTWINSDGLFNKFGRDEGTVGGVSGVGYAAYYSNMADAGVHTVEVVLNPMTAIPLLANGVAIVSDTVTIEAGARIDEVILITDTLATGAGATLDVGLIDQDRTTELDYNGLLAAVALTSIDGAGETTVYRAGVSGAGALVGTTLTNTGLITVNYNTAAYTAGKCRVVIHYKLDPLV